MTDLRDLYQELILDHNRAPRNFRRMEDATGTAEGYNPLCGDRIQLFLKMAGDRIEDVAFQGSGCAISKAAASMMTACVKGKTRAEAREIFEEYHGMISGRLNVDKQPHRLGKLTVFSGVTEFPARVKCATLAWHTLRSGLEGKVEHVTTEKEI